MPIIPIDLGYATWPGPNAGSFRPLGKIEYHGNPDVWANTRLLHGNPLLYGGKATGKQKGMWSARIFVGLNVGSTPRWSISDVVRIVRETRTAQVGKADSSFISQRGLYTQGAEVVDEASVQVGIVNLPYWEIGKKAFKEQMIELAEKLARDLEQESVILEIQKDGLVRFSWTVGP